MQCPQCGSERLYRDGLRYLNSEEAIQRWLCRNCGFRFSDPERQKHRGSFYNNPSKREKWRGCDIENLDAHPKLVKLLVEEKSAEAMATRESTEQTKNLKGKIVDFIWFMKKNGYSKDSIVSYAYAIKMLSRNGADLSNPEHVKEALAQLEISNAYKRTIIAAYTLYLKMQGLKWDPPICNVTRTLPFIPTEEELDSLISAAGKKSVFLQLLKETGMRVGEASRLKWVNVDLQRKTVTLNQPEKHGKSRIFNISDKLANMLGSMPKGSEYVFGTCSKITRGSVYYRLRKRIAEKLKNPRLLNIGFHTFRHWKATMLYHQTRDIVLVKEFLGHRSLDTTLLYIQLEQALFKNDSEEFIVKATSDPEEIKALLEVGFDFVCSKDNLMFFRKRK